MSSPAGSLAEAQVVVLGAGRAGAAVALQLAGSGVGRIGIVDGAAVSEADLSGQVVHAREHLGANKADSAAARVMSYVQGAHIDSYPVAAEQSNVLAIASEAHCLIDTTGSSALWLAGARACAVLGSLHLIEAGHGPIDTLVVTAPGKTACVRCGHLLDRLGGKGSSASAAVLAAVAVATALHAIAHPDLRKVAALFAFEADGTIRRAPLGVAAQDCETCGNAAM